MESDNFSHQKDNPCVWTVEHSKEFGRYLVASKDIEARTQIILEKPVVSGPADDERNLELGEIPMCLGCFKRMTNCAGNRCRQCGWPVCGPECEIADSHAGNECPLFRSNEVTYPCRHAWPILNKTILALRTLLLKTKRPEVWEDSIMKLEHHTEIRQTKPYCKKGDEMILENFAHLLKSDEYGSELSEDILRISGIINVNAFTATKSNTLGKCVRLVQCIYPEASLLAHSCIPNSSWTIDMSGETNDLHISIRSAIPIKKGEMITIAYNLPETMSGTLHRLISTEDVAHFICHCMRCQDPTEMGTFVSAIKCFNCEMEYLLSECPTNPDADWRCGRRGRSCGSVQHVPNIVLFLNDIEESYERIKGQYLSREKEVKKLEAFLKVKGNILHENHYILQEVRMRIINLQASSLESLEEVEVNAFIAHCRFMLRIADVLMPGFSKTRALLQFFLSQGLLRTASLVKSLNSANEEEYDGEQLAKLFKDIHYLQTRALLYFADQHSNSSSGANQFAKCIKRQLQNVERHIY